MGDSVRHWDEFSPDVYRLEAGLSARVGGRIQTDRAATTFGMREFRTRGTNFVMNGTAVFLRGTLECCVFPLTGYPPMETPEWERIFRVAKDYGLPVRVGANSGSIRKEYADRYYSDIDGDDVPYEEDGDA